MWRPGAHIFIGCIWSLSFLMVEALGPYYAKVEYIVSGSVKITRYDTARSGNTKPGFGVDASKLRDMILHAVAALRVVLAGDYEERRATANASYSQTLSGGKLGFRLIIYYAFTRVKITRYDTERSGSTEGGNSEEVRVAANSRRVKITRYNTERSGSTEGEQMRDTMVPALWVLSRVLIETSEERQDGSCSGNPKWGFGADTLNHVECGAEPTGGSGEDPANISTNIKL
ncbi:hypothetical protein B0H11DRAFT_1922843 [Mycena galericulata]|nr:hypothetical protein B0H11DRAFT_1922843 [Mycena galericulata]